MPELSVFDDVTEISLTIIVMNVIISYDIKPEVHTSSVARTEISAQISSEKGISHEVASLSLAWNRSFYRFKHSCRST